MHGFHGDVNFKAIESLPAGLKKVSRKDGYFVLAEGEVTGHAHRIQDECAVYEKNGVLYLKNDTPVRVRHEEHKTISVPPGTWKIGITREYDHLNEEIRNVCD